MEDSAESDPGFVSFATDAIHAGTDPKKWTHKAVVPPIVLATTFQIDEPKRGSEFSYSRSNNPSRSCLQECLAAIEGAKKAYCFASGLAATTTACHLLTSGDKIICSADVYGGTFRYFKYCATKMGLATTFVDLTDLKKLEDALNCKPKMVWFEIVTNPTLKIIDLEAIVGLVKKKAPDALICVDNTFLTPYLLRPLDYGVDIVMHSVTKYINGHSDVLMGCLATKNEKLAEEIYFYQMALGAVPSPFDCFLVQRGVTTMAIRLREHCNNALTVAEYLESHPLVEKVLYPGLASHPQHNLAKKMFRGHGGMISFYIKGSAEQTKVFLKSLKKLSEEDKNKVFDRHLEVVNISQGFMDNNFFIGMSTAFRSMFLLLHQIISLGFSLGGFESLAELPCTMTHSSLSEDERQEIGVYPNLVRLSVGLENPADLSRDLDNALKIAMK